MNHIKRQKDMTLKDELPWSVRVKYTTGGEQRNSSRSNEEAERKRKYSQLWICPVAKAKSNAVNTNIALQTWNVRSMNQGKLDVVKQEQE